MLSFRLAVRLPDEVKGLKPGCFLSNEDCRNRLEDSSEVVLTVACVLATDRFIEEVEVRDDSKEILISLASLFMKEEEEGFCLATAAADEETSNPLRLLVFRLL